ncbi:hypothetical protein NL676_023115 [Syzygium grande]|nr:hypothetical protein NL676_023115 [Syzygium grande]
MEKILTSKVAVVAMILLFLMGASMRPSKACRVLINGHGGAQVNREEPSLIVLQTLKKGSAPCTGNCGGYTPGNTAAAASTTTAPKPWRADQPWACLRVIIPIAFLDLAPLPVVNS